MRKSDSIDPIDVREPKDQVRTMCYAVIPRQLPTNQQTLLLASLRSDNCLGTHLVALENGRLGLHVSVP